jgi:AraC-like DNA-binding protein
MRYTRQDPELRQLTGPAYHALDHRQIDDWHYHDVQQLVYPSTGVLASTAATGTWIVPPQRAVWIPAGVAHSHQAHGPTQMRTLVFPATMGRDPGPPLPAGPAVVAVSPLLREIIVALTRDDGPPYTAAARENMERVALDQLRRVGQLPARLPTLADLGREVGASERTLSRLFRQEAGMSFPQWRTQLRLQRALVLLAEGATVTSAALACGWSNPSAFIEAFRRAFGATPGRFYAD